MQENPIDQLATVEEKTEPTPAPTPEIPREKEHTKQFTLRLPLSVIQDIEQVIEERRDSGEIIESSIYCRYVLQHHRDIIDAPRLRQENAELTQRLLELELHDVNAVEPREKDNITIVKEALRHASMDFAKEGFRTVEYYESVFMHYYQQILVQNFS